MSATRRRVVTALTVWFATRVVLWFVASGHILRHWGVPSVGDVKVYMSWAEKSLQYGHIPLDTKWQYPPLLAPILAVPQWISNAFGVRYLTSFTAMTFVADAVITALLLWTAAHRQVWSGPWFWILGVPLLGPIVYGRYDVFPALFVIFALVLLGKGAPVALAESSRDARSRAKRWLAGVSIGLGAAVKIWPGLTVFGMPRTRRGWQAIAGAVVGAVGSIAVLSIFYTHPLSFLRNQSGRGIEIESVWGVLLLLGKWFGFEHVDVKLQYGSYQAIPDGDGAMVTVVNVTYFLAMAGVALGFALLAYWWWRKAWRPAVTADATFVATLIMIVTSRVISPQYLIWLLAVGGFCLLYKDTTQRRSTLLLLISLPLTQWEFPFGFQRLIHIHILFVLVVLVRDLLLIAAVYVGFRDLWVSTVEGPFLPARVRGVLGRPVRDRAVAGAGAAGARAGVSLGGQRSAPASEAETEQPAQA